MAQGDNKAVANATANQMDNIRVVSFNNDKKDDEIDLLELMYALIDKLHYIVLCFLLGAVIFNAYSYFMIEPTYQSTAKLYIVSASDDSVVNLADLNIGSSLTSDYEELMLSYPVLDQVIDKMDLNMNYKGLAQMISISNPSDTRVLNITVTSTDPQLSCDIANTFAEISAQYLPDTMSTRAPNIAQVARVADHKAGPSYLKYTILGGMLGLLICCIIIIIGHLMDDTIHSPEDMEKYFGLVPLTTIPENDKFRADDSYARYGYRKGRHK